MKIISVWVLLIKADEVSCENKVIYWVCNHLTVDFWAPFKDAIF